MRYASICSGIEAATVAWHPLGWQPAFFAEIEKFPSAVLAHHYPSVPNLGDITRFKEWPDAAFDLLVGGTPCQSFSIAGLRKGLDDPRGNLMLTYLAIARRYRPRWLVWENVPGVLSSSEGRDFGAFLGGLAELGYHAAWRVLDAQFVRVDGFGRAVPQRRRRVFVVGHLGDWRRAAAVLFERESLSGHPAPRREAGKGLAPTIAARTKGGGGLGTDFDCDGGLIAGTLNANGKAAGSATQQDAETGMLVAFGGNDTSGPINVATARNAHGGPHGRLDFESETFIAFSSKDHGADAMGDISPTLRAMGHADSHANAGGQVAIAIQERAVCENPDAGPDGAGVRDDGTSYTLEARQVPQAVAFDTTQITSRDNRCNPQPGDPCHPLAAGAQAPAIAWSIMPQNSSKDYKAREVQVAQPVMAGGPVGGNQGGDYIQSAWQVRRLTPRECERLQGFPDDYTLIIVRGKPAADGPRYKALGNSMAVNCMRWIGRRIEMVEAIQANSEAA